MQLVLLENNTSGWCETKQIQTLFFCSWAIMRLAFQMVKAIILAFLTPLQWIQAKQKLPWHSNYVVLTKVTCPLTHLGLLLWKRHPALPPSLSSSLPLYCVTQKANVTTKHMSIFLSDKTHQLIDTNLVHNSKWRYII